MDNSTPYTSQPEMTDFVHPLWPETDFSKAWTKANKQLFDLQGKGATTQVSHTERGMMMTNGRLDIDDLTRIEASSTSNTQTQEVETQQLLIAFLQEHQSSVIRRIASAALVDDRMGIKNINETSPAVVKVGKDAEGQFFYEDDLSGERRTISEAAAAKVCQIIGMLIPPKTLRYESR